MEDDELQAVVPDEEVNSEVEPGEIQESEEAATPDDTDEVDTADEPEADPGVPKGVKKRFDELTREKYAARALADKERSEREYWQKKALDATEARASAPVPTGVQPGVDDYDTYEDYLGALTDWKVEQRLSEQRVENTQQAEQRAKAELHSRYMDRASQAQDRYTDYDAVAHGQHWIPSETMTNAILESEQGPDIAYWLGSNPGEAERIARLGNTEQLMELGRVAAHAAKPPKKKATGAPPPIKPAGAKATAEKSPDEMSDAEFNAWRRKQISSRRGYS